MYGSEIKQCLVRDQEMSNSNLEFRKIKSLNYLYEISEDGRIFRNVKSKKQNKIKLDFHHAEKGYYTTFIHVGGRQPGNKTIRVTIHKVVAEAWLGPCPEGLQVDHIDRNPHNNHYTNLRYVTQSEQMKNRVLGEHVIAAAKRNIAKHQLEISKPVLVDGKYFRSVTQASYYLAELHGKNSEHMRCKLKRKSKVVYGHTIEYLNAETRRTDSTE